MAQLLDGLYADRKKFANIDAIGSSFLYHAVADGAVAVADGAVPVADNAVAVADDAIAVADGAVAGAVADGAIGSDIYRYR